MQSRLLLDAETNQRLLYLSKRFGIPKTTLLRELVRAAVKDIYEVIPGDPLPAGLLPDLRGAGVDPENFRWFDLESVKEEEEKEEQQALRSGDLDEEPLEAVMNSIRNGLGMRKAGNRRGPGQPANPHSNAVFTQVHNTL